MKITLQWTHPNGLFGEVADLSKEEAEMMKTQMEKDGCHVELVVG